MRPIPAGLGLIVCLFLFNPLSTIAQEKDDVIPVAPGSFSLHGHIYHKHFKDSIPPPTSYVTDWENLYTDAQEAHIDSMLAAFEKKTGIQIAVVTIDSTMASAEDFDSLTMKIANSWGVGQEVIGISSGLRLMRIQNGSGISAKLSDEATQQIVNTDFLPYFEKGAYYKGTLTGLRALMQKLQPPQ